MKPNFFAHPMALVDTDDIGEHTRIWAFAHVMRGAHVGSNCNIGEHCFLEEGAWLGNNVTVKNGVSVWSSVTVEDNCFLGPNSVFTNDPHPRAQVRKAAGKLVPTLIKTGSTIGANATIVCGHTIGRFALIGAGAVVLRDVPEYALMVGNPSRQTGWVCECAAKLSLAVSAAIGDGCHCGECGVEFVRRSSGLARE
jgi:UDP-2-acetamido-3-amino-2,3-dideoxy-glucuronate N-acetyltransferase